MEKYIREVCRLSRNPMVQMVRLYVPSSENPPLHSRVYERIKFVHVAFVSQVLGVHSLMSTM